MIDLHIHTTASADAQHTPEEIFTMSRELGLHCIAFADHNTIDAVPAGLRLAQEMGVEFITGVELNTELDGLDVHMLGYGFDPEDVRVKDWFTEMQDIFWAVAAKRIARFVELGMQLDFATVKKHAKGRLPTGSSFLDALAETESNRSHSLVEPYLTGAKTGDPYVNFYFDILCNGGPADVGEAALPGREAIQRLLSIGAVPVLAHPRDITEAQLREMIDAGLMGIEAYCSYHNLVMGKHWADMAGKYDLLITAGSDFHGKNFKANVDLGGVDHNVDEIVVKLREAIEKVR